MATRDFHFILASRITQQGRPGISSFGPGFHTTEMAAVAAAGVKLPTRVSSYATAAARDAAAAKLAKALAGAPVDTSNVVIVRTSSAAMVGGDTTYELLDGTALDIHGVPLDTPTEAAPVTEAETPAERKARLEARLAQVVDGLDRIDNGLGVTEGWTPQQEGQKIRSLNAERGSLNTRLAFLVMHHPELKDAPPSAAGSIPECWNPECKRTSDGICYRHELRPAIDRAAATERGHASDPDKPTAPEYLVREDWGGGDIATSVMSGHELEKRLARYVERDDRPVQSGVFLLTAAGLAVVPVTLTVDRTELDDGDYFHHYVSVRQDGAPADSEPLDHLTYSVDGRA